MRSTKGVYPVFRGLRKNNLITEFNNPLTAKFMIRLCSYNAHYSSNFALRLVIILEFN